MFLLLIYISNINNNKLKNEIICIYNKQEDEINLLHDYTCNTNGFSEEGKKSYIEGLLFVGSVK